MLSCMDSLLIKHQNTDKELVFRWTKVANDTKCNPPFPEKELRDMFDKQCIKFAEEKIFANREGVRDNSTNNNDNLISLDITESLQQEQILTRFVVDKTTSCITVSLNHAYEKKTIVSNISRNWSETRDIFVDIAKKKGVSDKHIDMLVDVLDDNNRKIMQCLNEQAKKDATRVDKDIVALDLVQEQIDELLLDEVKSPYATIKINEIFICYLTLYYPTNHNLDMTPSL